LRFFLGGGSIGVMGATSAAAHEAGGAVLGVIPASLAPREVSGTELPIDTRVCNTMHERKQMMAMNADAFIALPGGIGTMEELFGMLRSYMR
jgi:uncharacterized protein (TIGR00730 family)